MTHERRLEVVVLAGGGVAHVSGGVGTLMLYLMEAWSRRPDGPRVRVLDTRGSGGLAGAALCFLRAAAALVWYAATGRAAVVHAHMTTRGSTVRKCLLCALAGLLGRPTIMHMHGADFMAFHGRLHPVWRRLVDASLRRAAFVVALGEGWRAFLTGAVGVSADRVAIVMNGVPAPELHSPELAAPGHAACAGPVRLLFLGRLGERKGVPELLAALASPELRARAWTATLAGDGAVDEVRDVVARSGLADRVDVPGWVDRGVAARLLRTSDVLVLPSRDEAMPMAVIEALAHRLAVVATPVGVITEFLADGVNAMLVPPGEPAALARALATLIDDPVRRAALAMAGHAVFLDRLDVAGIAERMLGLYRDAVRRHATRSGGTPAGVQAVLDRIEPVARPDDVAALLARLCDADRPTVVSFVNQHALNLAWRTPGFATHLDRADVLLRDGVGIGVCLRLLGRAAGLNMNGSDFIPMLLAAYAGRRIALFGTAQPWLDRAATAIARLGCTVVATLDGYQSDDAYLEAARACGADMVVLAMGMPRQERVAATIAAGIASPVVIVNGGAIADFLAGRFARAPGPVRKAGLEWLFRLCLEPGRLWRRYGPGGAVFVLRMFQIRRAMRARALAGIQ